MSYASTHVLKSHFTLNQKQYENEINYVCQESCNDIEKHKLESKIGPIFYPHSNVQEQLKQDGKVIRGVFYEIGDFGFRKPYDELNANFKKKHLILAGDSNIFGEWCKNNETLDAQLIKFFPDHQIYNWGIRGGGPHNTLAFMQNFNFKNIIPANQGIFSYTFFPQYMYSRVIGSKNYTAWDDGKSPYYQINKNGTLNYKGNFNDRKFYTFLYKLITSNTLLNKLLPEIPRISTEDILLVSAIFTEMKKAYLKYFSHVKFVIIINNSLEKSDENLTDELVNDLKKNQIDVEVIPFNSTLSKNQFEDGHINSIGQAQLANLYSKILHKY